MFSPLAAFDGKSSETTQWVSFIAGESLGAYNLSIDTNKESKNDIFKKNLIAWHLFAATVGVTGYIMGDFNSEQSLSIKPNYNGDIHFVYNKKF